MESVLGAMQVFLWLTTFQALAGYGDIAPMVGEYPSWEERDVHIWTNMMRVDPEEFFGAGNDWGGPCELSSFQGDEAEPKAPLYYDFDLNDAGRFHSTDMRESNWFSHDSSDGTSFGDRMARFYDESGYIGENIAQGYPNGQSVLIDGWMCSPGHRANIMNGDFNELGVGVDLNYYTQDFAAGTVDTMSPIAMGNHSPKDPSTRIDFFADFQGGVPRTLEVVVNGTGYPMDLTFGDPDQGVYMASFPLSAGPTCIEYYFRWTMAGTSGTFPASQSYLAGLACPSPYSSVSRQLREENGDLDFEDTDENIAGCLCSSKGPMNGRHLGMLSLLCGLLWATRRS